MTGIIVTGTPAEIAVPQVGHPGPPRPSIDQSNIRDYAAKKPPEEVRVPSCSPQCLSAALALSVAAAPRACRACRYRRTWEPVKNGPPSFEFSGRIWPSRSLNSAQPQDLAWMSRHGVSLRFVVR